MMTTPSSTFTITQKGNLTANAAGITGIMFGGSFANGTTNAGEGGSAIELTALCVQTMLVPTFTSIYSANTVSLVEAPNSWAIGCAMTSSATLTNLFFQSDETIPMPTIQLNAWRDTISPGDGGAAVPTMFDRVRLVSAVLTVASTGTAIGSSGRMIGAALPGCTTLQRPSEVTTAAQIENRPGAQTVYINANKAINVIYDPVDPTSWNYAQLPGAVETAGVVDEGANGVLQFTPAQEAAAGVGTVYVPDGGYNGDSDFKVYSPGELWVVVVGAQPSQPFQYILTLNYEGIPRSGQSALLPVGLSHADPIAAATALNANAKAPRVTQGNTNLVPNTAPHIQHNLVSSKPSMIDRILGGVGKAGDIVSKVAPIVASML